MEESSYIHKSHNVTALIYHLVTPAKYRKVILNQELDEYLCKICDGIEDRYEIRFLEIGIDDDRVHFLLQSVPMYKSFDKKLFNLLKKSFLNSLKRKL